MTSIAATRWAKETVYIIGGGQSAAHVDLEALKGKGIVIAINSSAAWIMWADAVFSADASWITQYLSRKRRQFVAFQGARIAAVPQAEDVASVPGLEVTVRRGANNSGYEAIWYAIEHGARRIILVGFDMTVAGHWHGQYTRLSMREQCRFPVWIDQLNETAPTWKAMGVQVLNANALSAVRCFPFTHIARKRVQRRAWRPTEALDNVDPALLQQHGEMWLPAGDTHFPKHAREKSYQYPKLKATVKMCRNYRVAVDVGAHVGFWSMHLAEYFDTVQAFEPDVLNAACLQRNVGGCERIKIHRMAIGECAGMVATAPNTVGNSGERLVVPGGDVPLRRLDDIDLGGPVDLLKVDCEGFELFVLGGAEATIMQYRPVIVFELHDPFAARWGVAAGAPLELLREWGYEQVAQWNNDYLMVPKLEEE